MEKKLMLDTVSVRQLGVLLEEAAGRLLEKRDAIYYHADPCGEAADEANCEPLCEANNTLERVSDVANSMARELAAIQMLADALKRRKNV
jgi:hypothetical protein